MSIKSERLFNRGMSWGEIMDSNITNITCDACGTGITRRYNKKGTCIGLMHSTNGVVCDMKTEGVYIPRDKDYIPKKQNIQDIHITSDNPHKYASKIETPDGLTPKEVADYIEKEIIRRAK